MNAKSEQLVCVWHTDETADGVVLPPKSYL